MRICGSRCWSAVVLIVVAAGLVACTGCPQPQGMGSAANGETLFNAQCVGCHSAAAVKPGAGLISTTGLGLINAAMTGITLTNQQVLDLQAFLATQ